MESFSRPLMYYDIKAKAALVRNYCTLRFSGPLPADSRQLLLFKKNLNASKPSEHPPQVEECLKV